MPPLDAGLPLARDSLLNTASDWLDRLLAEPAKALGLLCAAQVLFWTLACALTHYGPTRDMVESYLWGHEWVIGTPKHPNMPGLILETGRRLTGSITWPGYFSSELLLVGTYVCTYALGVEMMGPRRALAGVLLLTGLFYMAWPSTLMNHDVVQMPIWAGLVWQLWRLRSRPALTEWLVLGAVAALGLYAKLSFGVFIACCGLWILYDGALLKQLSRPAPWAGLVLFGVLCLPLLNWLRASNFSALNYAREENATGGASPWEFLGGQILTSIGVLALAVLAGLIWRQGNAAAPAPANDPPLPTDISISYLAHMLLLPNLMTTWLAWMMSSGTRGMWGTPMLSLLGLLVIALVPARLDQAMLKRIAIAAGSILVIMPLIYIADTLIEPRLTGHPKRQGWPQAEMNRRFQALWTQQTGKPLRIVAGDFWTGGLVALSPGDMPSIFTNGNFDTAPWITPERLKREGALLIWQVGDPAAGIPLDLAPIAGSSQPHIERFQWPLFTDAPPLLIGYAIVPPA
jgi:Dolichyl-phosphate-mannose-protein mannosyltransferase